VEIARAEAGRGDLVGWRGHVGLLVDASRLIHANARQMAVVIEPLDEAIARMAAAAGGPTVFRRL
jgi:cell wall-associated NlpC family hydrolase